MRKVLYFCVLFSVSMSLSAQKISEKDMSVFKKEWKAYSDSCYSDSTLYVYWEYTGKEKKESSVDTTGGRNIKVVTIIPTRQMKWMKETPSMDGFEKYINKRKDE